MCRRGIDILERTNPSRTTVVGSMVCRPANSGVVARGTNVGPEQNGDGDNADEADVDATENYLRASYAAFRFNRSVNNGASGTDGEADTDDGQESSSPNRSIRETRMNAARPSFDEGNYIEDQVLENIGFLELLLVLEREMFNPNGES